ncbi:MULTISPECIES: hypothetical protein [unclassified Moorena]|uniref:hypothetical protein n=1 Tax=unclassified Moorena TaxID=2683338 RepID=UPI001400F058|nr:MULTISPECIES: hypothetical protein [unclassified Moorena]NEO13430.1 hypothetical protein [Moorena sp. SIO3E8]NEQ00765.1 hypothetical protein [Moorena sp. SIO3F7]
MTHKIYAPNIHLFAFHLRNLSSSDSQPDTDYNSQLLWHKYDQICAKFQIQQKLDLRDVAEGYRIALLKGATTDNILLPLEGKLSLKNGKGITITGQACPLQIYDSYALGLNIRIPERENNQKTEDVDLTVFNYFNPDQCFLPSKINSNINSSLGQILLLTAWLPQKHQQDSHVWKEIADQCVQNFLGEKDKDKCPPLYQEGQLFDSPIFEYGIPDKSQDYGQIFVWLFLGEEVNGNYSARADENFCWFYQNFIDLFFYRQKVIRAYQISRDVYSDVKQQYQDIKKIINETTGHRLEAYATTQSQDKTTDHRLEACATTQSQDKTTDHRLEACATTQSQDKTTDHRLEACATTQSQDNQRSLSEAELLDFKHKLRILPKLDLNYSDLLGQLESYSFTMKINAQNYSEKLQQLQEKLPKDDLRILSVFSDKISHTYQEQIKINLSYFGHSSGLLDKAISSIRGIVEIEQAERDRALEKALRDKEEADRARDKEAEKQEKRQQLWITFVGTGLAVSGISSQSDAKQPLEVILIKLDRKESLDCPKAGLYPCLTYTFWFVLFHILIGVGVGAIAAFIVDRIIHRRSK